MTDIDRDDVSAMRRQGDFRAFLRGQIADGASRRDAKPRPTTPQPPGHVPGAWPAGTQPPSRPPDQPPEAWAQALAEYRAWDAAGQPPGTRRCECGCVSTTETRS